MKTLALLLLVVFPITATAKPPRAKPKPVVLPSGPLSTHRAPLYLDQVGTSSVYASLSGKLSAEKIDGAQVLKELRELEPGLAAVEQQIDSVTKEIVNPSNKYQDDFFKMLDGNPWASPIFQYASGDDSDDEQVYVWVNRDLRSKGPHEQRTAVWLTKMRAALEHLPEVHGLSFRGTRLTMERIDQYFPNHERMVDNALISTSVEPSTAFKFAHPGVNGPDDQADAGKIAVVMVVRGKTGRAISVFAHIEHHEQEILFANGTPMKVASRSEIFADPDLGNTMVIFLTEE